MTVNHNPTIAFRVRLVPGLTARAEDNGPALIQRATEDLGDYYDLLDRSRPQLSEREWLLLMDVLNGTILDRISVSHIWAEVDDATRDDPGLAGKWEVNVSDLIERLRAMSSVERLAVADTVRRFWLTASTVDHREALRNIGVIGD